MLLGGQEAEHLVTEYINLDNPDQVDQSLVQFEFVYRIAKYFKCYSPKYIFNRTQRPAGKMLDQSTSLIIFY